LALLACFLVQPALLAGFGFVVDLRLLLAGAVD